MLVFGVVSCCWFVPFVVCICTTCFVCCFEVCFVVCCSVSVYVYNCLCVFVFMLAMCFACRVFVCSVFCGFVSVVVLSLNVLLFRAFCQWLFIHVHSVCFDCLLVCVLFVVVLFAWFVFFV